MRSSSLVIRLSTTPSQISTLQSTVAGKADAGTEITGGSYSNNQLTLTKPNGNDVSVSFSSLVSQIEGLSETVSTLESEVMNGPIFDGHGIFSKNGTSANNGVLYLSWGVNPELLGNATGTIHCIGSGSEETLEDTEISNLDLKKGIYFIDYLHIRDKAAASLQLSTGYTISFDLTYIEYTPN